MPRKKAKGRCQEFLCTREANSEVEPDFCRYHTSKRKEVTSRALALLLSTPKKTKEQKRIEKLMPWEAGFIWKRKSVINCPLCFGLITEMRTCPTPEKHDARKV